jgi:predicted DNA-binding transcriptional regulator AlpA
MTAMVHERITRKEIEQYKREVLEQSVLIRLDEAAAIMAVSRSTVIRRVEEGKLIPYNDNHTRKGLRFLASELREYVRNMKAKIEN